MSPRMGLFAVVAVHAAGLLISGAPAEALVGGSPLAAQTAAAFPLTEHSAPLDSLRHHFHGAVDDEERIEAAARLQERLEPVGTALGLVSPSVWKAYGGAIELLRAREARWPLSKLSHLRAGMAALDEAVGQAPHDAEVRYLRVASEAHLPGLFRREGMVRGDIAWLREELEAPRHELGPALEALVRGFLESIPEAFTDER